MARTAVHTVLSGALLFGCASSSPSGPGEGMPGPLVGGQTGGENGLNCTAQTPLEPLAMGSRSELGFSATQALAPLAVMQTLDLTWADGSSTPLKLAIAGSGKAGYARACRALEVDVSVRLDTGDGALADVAPAKLFARQVDWASLTLDFSLASLRGTLNQRLTGSRPQDTLVVHLDFTAGAASGEIDATDLSATEPATSVATF